MIKHNKILFSVVFLFVFSGLAYTDTIKIAISDFINSNREAILEKTSDIFPDIVEKCFNDLKGEGIEILSKEMLEAMLDKSSLELTDIYELKKLRLLHVNGNINYIITGSVAKSKDRYYIDLRVVEIETGELYYSGNLDCNNLQELKEKVKIFAKCSIENIVGKKSRRSVNKNIIIYTLDENELIKDFGVTGADMLTTSLVNKTYCKIIDRRILEAILNANGKAIEDNLNIEEVVKYGKLLNASYGICGEVKKAMNQKILEISTYDIDKANKIFTHQVDILDDLTSARKILEEYSTKLKKDIDERLIQKKGELIVFNQLPYFDLYYDNNYIFIREKTSIKIPVGECDLNINNKWTNKVLIEENKQKCIEISKPDNIVVREVLFYEDIDINPNSSYYKEYLLNNKSNKQQKVSIDLKTKDFNDRLNRRIYWHASYNIKKSEYFDEANKIIVYLKLCVNEQEESMTFAVRELDSKPFNEYVKLGECIVHLIITANIPCESKSKGLKVFVGDITDYYGKLQNINLKVRIMNNEEL